jgi:hypothetical protein
MKATIVGTLTGLTAAAAMIWFGPRAPAVREAPLNPAIGQPSLSGRFLPTTQTANVRRQLARVIPTVKCDAMPLSKFINWLEDTSGLNVYVEWRELNAAAVGPDSPISLDVRNVTVGTVLQLALDQAHMTGPRVGYAVLDGIVKVSILSRLDRVAMVRVYDVRDLIEAAVKLKLRLEPRSMPNISYDGRPDPEADAAERLQDILREASAAAGQNFGNDGEQMSYFGGRLVVTHTQAGHDTIAAILAGLRAKSQ